MCEVKTSLPPKNLKSKDDGGGGGGGEGAEGEETSILVSIPTFLC